MIKKFSYGTPFDTEAVVKPLDCEMGQIPYFEIKDGSFVYGFSEQDIVYGLGEQVRGINKRGWKYISWNYDNSHHHEDTNSLYGSHNFLVISGKDTFGVFFDYPGKLEFDIGYAKRSEMKVLPEKFDLDVYIVTGEDIKDIVHQFRQLIGKSYLPPMWAFGYGQSRWGYKNEADVREIAQRYEELGIPIESIYMDIDYMERYKNFTVDKNRFPDLEKLSADMKAKGIHLVPIIDAGVKIEDGYDVYEEGVEKGFFCKNKDGGDFVGAVWPGKVHFPDFLQPRARDWFGKKYEFLTKQGIDGFWNDMNEPAIFYTEDRLEQAFEKMRTLEGKNIGVMDYFDMTRTIATLNGNEGDYDKFYHNVNGKMVNHRDVHNIFGMNMTRAAYEALEKIEPEKRTLFFSRSSYVGAHRYGGIWQGDNRSWWQHILLSMQQLPALNMCGFLFIGPDTGGFGSNTTEDLVLRWLQYTMFTPLLRNHSALGSRQQELYQFSNVGATGEMVKIRYSLIPYLYSEFLKARENDTMMFRPLAFDFPQDERAKTVEDQLFLGDEVMIAPIYTQNARGRYVYLPEEMMLVRMRTSTDFDTEILNQGNHYVPAELNEVIFFVRKDRAIPFAKTAKNTAELDRENLSTLGYAGAEYEMYSDDGISQNAPITKKIIK